MSLDLSYLAGFFDGEGSINILTRKRKNWNTEYQLTVAIGQKDGATLDWLKENYGGNVYLVKRDGSFYWACSNRAAQNFLQQLLPYLKYKKPQAELALTYFNYVRTIPISKRELERRESIRLGLIELKKSIIPSKFAATTTKRTDPKGM